LTRNTLMDLRMTTLMILAWFGLLFLSYKGAEMLLKKSNRFS
jgi:hypothetical protein